MHIEISAGGLRGGVAVASFQSGMKKYISGTNSMISSFKAVSAKTYNLNGGVGRLVEAVGQVNARVNTEENRKSGAETVQRKANDFLDLAIRVDKSVAAMVKQNREELYGKYPGLRPTPGQWIKDRLADAWSWLCNKGQAVIDKAKQAEISIKDTVKKAWNSIVTFYTEHKELIDKIVGTVLIVVGAVAAIAAVIATGGLALAPLIGAGLTALGISATTAAAIGAVVSAAIGITAVLSTIGASTMNVAEIWTDKSDDATFQKWKKVLNIISTVTNTFYSIGNLYNAYKGTTGAEYLSKNRTSGNIDRASVGKPSYSRANATRNKYQNTPDNPNNIESKAPWRQTEIKGELMYDDRYGRQIPIDENLHRTAPNQKGNQKLDLMAAMDKNGRWVDANTVSDFSKMKEFDLVDLKRYKYLDSLDDEIMYRIQQRGRLFSQNGAKVRQTFLIDTAGFDRSVTTGEVLDFYKKFTVDLPRKRLLVRFIDPGFWFHPDLKYFTNIDISIFPI